MRMPFALRHAQRESRTTWRRVGLYMASITLGVAALVAINSFRTNILESIQAESRNLLGADLELHSRRPFPDSVNLLLDSLAAAAVPVSHVTTVATMAYAPSTDFSRLVQLKALNGDFPYYGEIGTDPTSAWGEFQTGRYVVVDPAVAIELDVSRGDTIRINDFPLVIAGMITTSPGEVSFQGAIGPRVFVAARYLEQMALIRIGSLARYQAYLKIESAEAMHGFLDEHRDFFRANQVGYDTVAERVDELTFAVGSMTRFLGLVGLVALLLGGVGVASAIHVYIKEKLDTVAVLRCLGARQRTLFSAYLVQAAALGFGGAAVGVVLGIVVQVSLPPILGDLIPLDVSVSINWWMVGAGLTIGVWVAGIFALLPLLTIWDVTPLRALRRDFEVIRSRRKGLRVAAYMSLAASVIAIGVWQAPDIGVGLTFAAGISITGGMLWVTAVILVWATKRYFPRKARYVFRQGIANLFRPQNQTVPVTIALGFGVFLVATIYLVQRNIVDRFDLDASESQPNFAAFDIQPDQRAGVEQLFLEAGAPTDVTPIIPARMTHLKGRTIAEVMADSGVQIPRWAMRREYRHTSRDSMVETEELVAGDWWLDVSGAPDDGVANISIEEDLADNLGVGIGDRITWDVQGISVESQVVSIRRVNWARLSLNFFVVFQPGALDDAPQTAVTMTRIDEETNRAELQRALVQTFPNISVIDLSIVQNALNDIVRKVALAVRFMAGFSIASGLIVLIGAIATSRYHRIRESVLLKTLGASRRQIRQIFTTEYAALGSLASVAGIGLAAAAGWALMRFFFELEYRIPPGPMVTIWLAVTALTLIIGLASSGTVVNRPPLAVIRELSE